MRGTVNILLHLHTVNILLHWISAALAAVQASLVFSPYLPIKSNKRET